MLFGHFIDKKCTKCLRIDDTRGIKRIDEVKYKHCKGTGGLVMEGPAFSHPAKTPGFDALQSSFHDLPQTALNDGKLAPYVENSSHYAYLQNAAFHQYLKIHKVAVNASGAKELVALGEQLETEYMPRFKDAAAWAFTEAGLMDTTLSTLERVNLVSRAEALWEEALMTEGRIQSSEYSAVSPDIEGQYRLALSLAYTPLMKSIIVGSVTTAVRHQALVDTVQFSGAVSNEITRYESVGDMYTARGLIGLQHELNALSALLYIDDPRYIPFPSTARADTGYYHRGQTHDIMVVNQHWGSVKKIIPVEIKAKPSRKDRRRYQSLLVRGKMHLTISGHDPRETSALFQRVILGEDEPATWVASDGYSAESTYTDERVPLPSVRDVMDADRMATDLREMLRLYQMGDRPESIAVNSLTKFHKSKPLDKAHPEIAA